MKKMKTVAGKNWYRQVPGPIRIQRVGTGKSVGNGEMLVRPQDVYVELLAEAEVERDEGGKLV